eukprot:TRINITY_DN11374_c0_g1_i1.p1 TRINITY_DN11374_c0_g1~~TRINITY_DN11374_c0_g1_i1.p1  ORF type:complete len:250 (-),score=12.59 TRINITY_DN11374_c0_g1_i1:37-786(-)
MGSYDVLNSKAKKSVRYYSYTNRSFYALSLLAIIISSFIFAAVVKHSENVWNHQQRDCLADMTDNTCLLMDYYQQTIGSHYRIYWDASVNKSNKTTRTYHDCRYEIDPTYSRSYNYINNYIKNFEKGSSYECHCKQGFCVLSSKLKTQFYRGYVISLSVACFFTVSLIGSLAYNFKKIGYFWKYKVHIDAIYVAFDPRVWILLDDSVQNLLFLPIFVVWKTLVSLVAFSLFIVVVIIGCFILYLTADRR